MPFWFPKPTCNEITRPCEDDELKVDLHHQMKKFKLLNQVLIPWRTWKLFSCKKPSNCKRKQTPLCWRSVTADDKVPDAAVASGHEGTGWRWGCILHWTGTHLLNQVTQNQMSVKAYCLIHLSFLFKIYSCYFCEESYSISKDVNFWRT